MPLLIELPAFWKAAIWRSLAAPAAAGQAAAPVILRDGLGGWSAKPTACLGLTALNLFTLRN